MAGWEWALGAECVFLQEASEEEFICSTFKNKKNAVADIGHTIIITG